MGSGISLSFSRGGMWHAITKSFRENLLLSCCNNYCDTWRCIAKYYSINCAIDSCSSVLYQCNTHTRTHTHTHHHQGGLFNFHPAVRPVQLEVHIQGFPGKHYCPRMATMNKPSYTTIQTHSPDKPVLIFVSSRRQTRLTAFDLVAYVGAKDNPKQWLHMPEPEVK